MSPVIIEGPMGYSSLLCSGEPPLKEVLEGSSKRL